MSLNPGTRLGPYEILTPIGAGGMGEVYRARDSRLGREVAIKILPESLARDSERLRRFEQEARSVGALNHPNILSVYDIGVNSGTPFMVTELLRGATLGEKIGTGPLSPKRAMEYAHQIASGLAAAHEQAIIHRDLKPDNLFITTDGRVKILDFGLAKQNPATVATSDVTATVAASPRTSDGMVLGTVGYMSPEQVRGKAVDHRTDIFAFGAVLYEILTGQRAFRGNSAVETMTAILKEEPPEISTADRQIPPALDRITRRCLEKDPEQRFQSAKDVSFALDSISAGTGQSQALSPMKTKRKHWPIAAGAALVILGIIAAFVAILLRPRELPHFRQLTFRKGYLQTARFAADGQTIVYSAAWDHPPSKLYSSRVNGTELRALELPPSELLAISKSGELAIASGGDSWLGVGGRLARVQLSGGGPREILDQVVSADWGPAGDQPAVARFTNGKCRVEYPIGKVLYENFGYITNLRFSPQGDAIAFMDHPILGDDRGTVVLLNLQGSKRVVTAEWEGEAGLAWSSNGKEVWFTATNTLDSERAMYALSRSGAERVVLRTPGGLYLDDVRSNGEVLLTVNERRFEVMLGENGREVRELSWLQIMLLASISRDGKSVTIGDWGGSTATAEYSVYLVKLDEGRAVLLGRGIAGSISPDNKWVTSILPRSTEKVVIIPTGMGETKTISAPGFQYRSAAWTSDSRNLIVHASDSGHPLRFWLQDLNGGSPRPRPITDEGVNGIPLVVAGNDYVCIRDESGKVKLIPVDGSSPKPVNGGSEADLVIGGSPVADNLYIIPNGTQSQLGINLSVPLQIYKLNIATGRRAPMLSISPSDPTGIADIYPPLFTPDEKRYVYTQNRAFSTLYSATGLK